MNLLYAGFLKAKSTLLVGIATTIIFFCVTFPALAVPDPAPVTVTVAGVDYQLTILNTTFDSSSAVLKAQPWYGNQSLANSIAQQYINNGGNTVNDLNSLEVVFAYGLNACCNDIFDAMVVSGTTSETSLKITSSTYDFVTTTSAASVPEINAGSLFQVLLILFAGWLSVRRRSSQFA